MIEVRLAAPLRPLVGGADILDVDGNDLAEVINNLETPYPGFREQLLESTGNIKRFIYIFRNAEDVRSLEGIKTRLNEGDVVLIFPAIAGG